MEELALLDWKRRIFALYAEVRAADDPEAAWRRWCAVRAELYRVHPQSPLVGGWAKVHGHGMLQLHVSNQSP